jgi:putative sterol carrier protein
MSSGEREMLAQAIRGKGDDEVSEFVDNMGGEMFLDQTFDGMTKALKPDRAEDATIAYELQHRGKAMRYAVVIRDRDAKIEKSVPSDARVTFRMSVPNYLRLITGQLPILKSVLLRRLKISGDRKFARRIEGMFGG